ncbi:MAG: helix-turn-helix domain-containing protein [Clostridiales bacterium]|nr:helix-turn-helix domain-containing protein [Clostridiales bacterium]
MLSRVVRYAKIFSATCRISVSIMDYEIRDFLPEARSLFCERCQLERDGRCDYRNTHLYGCFEGERWNGLYVYYCPLGIGFISAIVSAGRRPAYAMITGPMVIGSLADAIADSAGVMAESLLDIPRRTAEEATAVSEMQWALAAFLSDRDPTEAEAAREAQAKLHNALYELLSQPAQEGGGRYRYPVELEKQLRRMIASGDRQGAKEIINQLLGRLYFGASGDLRQIKENAKSIVALFERAAIDGGAEAEQIFGAGENAAGAIDACASLDELSAFLTAIFYRFVGYVFDFEKIKHTDVVYKALGYVRQHYAEKITLDDLAERVYLSSGYLGKILKNEIGMSFTDFLNSTRIEKSKHLLDDSTLSLAEISTLTGFSDQSYFTKVFQKTCGLSPGEYRKNRR